MSNGNLYQPELENKISELNFETGKLLKDGRKRGLEHILKIYNDITGSGAINRSISFCLDDKIQLCIDEKEELLDKRAKYRCEKELLQKIEGITGKEIEFVSDIDFTDEEKNILLNIEQQEEIGKVRDVVWGAYLGPRSVLGYSEFVQYKPPSFDATENKIIKLIEEKGVDSNGIKNEDYNTDGIILDKYLKTIGVTGVSADELYKKRKSGTLIS